MESINSNTLFYSLHHLSVHSRVSPSRSRVSKSLSYKELRKRNTRNRFHLPVGSRSNAVAVAYGAITETIGDGNELGLVVLVGSVSRPRPDLGDPSIGCKVWRANTRSKSVKSFSYNEAEEELTRNGSSIDKGRRSEDKKSNERFGHHFDKTNGVE